MKEARRRLCGIDPDTARAIKRGFAVAKCYDALEPRVRAVRTAAYWAFSGCLTICGWAGHLMRATALSGLDQASDSDTKPASAMNPVPAEINWHDVPRAHDFLGGDGMRIRLLYRE